MDLRIKKTQKRIFSAYLTLKEKYQSKEPPSKELCQLAGINKTTFYRYFENVKEFSSIITKFYVIELFRQKEEISLIDSPKGFLNNALSNYKAKQNEFDLVIKGNRELFIAEAEKFLSQKHKEQIKTKYDEITLNFIAGGISHFLFSFDINNLTEFDALCEILNKLTDAIKNNK